MFYNRVFLKPLFLKVKNDTGNLVFIVKFQFPVVAEKGWKM